MIPEKDLISILTEVHIADGLLTIPKIHNWFSSLDSLSTYSQIIEKHGYTKETMDKTIKYYFIKNPRKLINIYDKVLGILSEMESYIEKEFILEEAHKRNLWKGENSYSFFESSNTDSAVVRLSFRTPGIYTFSFSAIIYPDDQSLNPRIITYTCNADSIETGEKYDLLALNYIKDGQPHEYKMEIKVPTNIPTCFTGLMFVFDNNPAELQLNAIFESISIVYKASTAL